MKTSTDRVLLPVRWKKQRPARPSYLQPPLTLGTAPLPREFPCILKRIGTVLGWDSEVILAPAGIYARSRRGYFFADITGKGLAIPVAFRLPSCWKNLAGDKLEDGIQCAIVNDEHWEKNILISGPLWLMRTYLVRVSPSLLEEQYP